MQIAFVPDVPETTEACAAATGKDFAGWFAQIEAAGFGNKRREAIQHIYDATGRGKDVWWPTTIWVAYERARGVVQRDGRAEGDNICCTKGFKAPVSEVFRHFASEAALQAWIPGWQGAVQEGAPFTCGACSGSVGRVRLDKDLRMSWQSPGFGPTDVEVQFNDVKGKLTVNIYHKRIASRAEADGLRRAWGEALDRLKGLVA